jgi:hypothetical protein
VNEPDETRPSLTYRGTTGFVAGSDTSMARADREARRAGTVQGTVLRLIHDAGADGRTSPEVEDATGMKHQSVSSSIRNLERDGRLVKTTFIRSGCHAYVTPTYASVLRPDQLLAPNPTRISWKAEYDVLVRGIGQVLAAHPHRGDASLFADPYDLLRGDLAALLDTSSGTSGGVPPSRLGG